MSVKKSLTVYLGTLCTIPLLYFAPGFSDSMANRTGLIMGIIPLAIFLGFASDSKPSDKGMFFSGLAIIILGVAFYLLMDTYGTIAGTRPTTKDADFWKHGQNTWLYFFPVVCLGLGINLISTFITHSSSSKETSE